MDALTVHTTSAAAAEETAIALAWYRNGFSPQIMPTSRASVLIGYLMKGPGPNRTLNTFNGEQSHRQQTNSTGRWYPSAPTTNWRISPFSHGAMPVTGRTEYLRESLLSLQRTNKKYLRPANPANSALIEILQYYPQQANTWRKYGGPSQYAT